MFPAAFDYIRAHSAEEALAALAQHGAEARILAGGQSLIPAMRLRLARPAVLVDLGGVKDLGYLREEGSELRVGAMTRDVTLERDANVRARYSLLTDTGAVVADPVVRCLGTVVGSLCHGDPSGDWGAAALASRAVMVARSASGERLIPIDQEFPRPLESRATQRCDGTQEEKRRSARHFPCCVLEEIFGRDRPFSA